MLGVSGTSSDALDPGKRRRADATILPVAAEMAAFASTVPACAMHLTYAASLLGPVNTP